MEIRKVKVEDLVSPDLAKEQGKALEKGVEVKKKVSKLLKSDEVKGDHRLQLQDAKEHVAQAVDEMGPVDEFVEKL